MKDTMCQCDSRSCPVAGACATPRRRRPWLLPLLFFAAVAGFALWTDARAEVFHSRESALRLAFPGADSVATQSLVIDREAAGRIEQAARVALPSRLLNVYVGWKGGEPAGYAYIESHKVRTLPQTLMVVVSPTGEPAAVHLLAFHEPKQYMPSDRWLAQFEGRELDEELSLRQGIAGIAGSTLSANAVTATVRRVLAVHELSVIPALMEDLLAFRRDG